ncbi:SUMF1/EgtB/PvdO family nonheme iron enzyme [uncultured Thiodictyon sp.]|uniref:NACHT domain-containing protein n=1 Tax=uncultured Thiodictyon sp. TaxID=1846217 RepID=UPI0025E0BEF5|nr:SUMF1/EgtB/PvdO family nonheme iron enzyme [uncultured Thiodictyon sp.]
MPLPVRVILRDFAAGAHFPPAGRPGDAGPLCDFIADDLRAKGMGDYAPVLTERLRRGEALVLLDGLDEVTQAGARRERLVQCIRAFAATFQKARLLVTCRPYAYADPAWRIPGFAQVGLADFGPGQVRRFVTRWYEARPEFEPGRRRERADKLQGEVLGRPALRDLAGRPLLLTLIAYLHANGHELPDRRAALYEELLKLLIDRWDRARFRTEDPAVADALEQHSLAEFLRVGREDVRRVLERLAFEVHATQAGVEGTADIPARNLTHELLCLARQDREAGGLVDALAVSDYLRDRVGILHQRGGTDERDAVYAFPHRSFQEFLAAAYLGREERGLFERFRASGCDEWPDLAAWLGRRDPDRWREVVLLAGGFYVGTDARSVWDLVDALSPDAAPPALPMCREDAWGLRLAGEILAECLPRERLKRAHQQIHDRIRDRLPDLLAGTALPAAERVAAALHLGRIGDPRPGVLDLDAMAFCRVPAGSFFLGATDADAFDDEKKGAGPHRLDYPYWVGRWPVTVAQFGRYLEQSGRTPGDPRCLRAPTNTPVVYVSWDEATACADWLTGYWRAKGWLPPDWRVALPSEPEWEKAAKGGEAIPSELGVLIRPVTGLRALPDAGQPSLPNPAPQRPYPWGPEPDPERMNVEMNIGRVSPVGCYPLGRSPYGCEDLSGNVWEWTRSRSAAYPYPEDAKGRAEREDRAEREHRQPGVRGARGGGFNYYRWDARASARSDDDPENRLSVLGFRLVVAPLLL